MKFCEQTFFFHLLKSHLWSSKLININLGVGGSINTNLDYVNANYVPKIKDIVQTQSS